MRVVFGSTDPGLTRSSNQDGFACERISDNMAYGVLCDGMGGENGGGIASAVAVEFAAQMLRRDLKEDMGELSLRSVLSSAIAGANALVYEKGQADPELTGMGTTIILAVLLGSTLYIAYVGDSRVYRLNGAEERQLTRDHTVVQMLVDIGEITPEDAKTHPKRHYITRAVGVSPEVEPDFIVEALEEGSIILLCSDGLYQYMEPGLTQPLIQECMAAQSADPLIQFANRQGGSDNITAIVMA
ncbi:Stp1/IreP family PP2C-type Ser/Thr phosphatase [Ruminococcaceae bacterium OttesenSCG-928-L11]|nr:Stp1/IreP family PP2C-type Ser/Thr phosphatase [Ruminococcaceae bacterium OttesenSCG-928-L11]